MEHSPIGGSSIERLEQCPGSRGLIEQLASKEERLQEWTTDGILAHSVIERCLRDNIEIFEFPDLGTLGLKPDQIDGITTAVEYCRGLPGRHFVEHELKHPAFHKLMFGRLDFAAIDITEEMTATECLTGNRIIRSVEIDDYKNGAGVVKEATNNPQTKHYAFMFIDGEGWPADLPRVTDDCPIKTTIIQPNAWHPDGPIRSWSTTAGDIRDWAHKDLKQIIAQTEKEQYLDVGAHCRFCPARLVCPAQQQLVKMWASEPVAELQAMSNERLGELYAKVEPVKIGIKALEAEVLRRNLDGDTVPGTKLVEGRKDRVWRENAEAEASGRFGPSAYSTPVLLSPAQMEKLGPAGKTFTNEYAYKPAGQPVVALVDDNRAAISPPKGEIVFAGYKE